MIANIKFADDSSGSFKGTWEEEPYGLVRIEEYGQDRVIFPWHTIKEVALKS